MRVAGATAGVELVADRDTREPLMADWVTVALRDEHRVAAREYGNTLVMAPPLVISRPEVDRAAQALADVLRRRPASHS